jgi:chorismate mutase
MRIRGIRGAIQLDKDSAEEMVEAVSELLTQMLTANQIDTEDLISIIFTATPDLTSEFPAVAARKIGLGTVPLLCSVEIDVAEALPRVVRVLMHAHLERSLGDVKHIYLRGATVLRKDLAQ